VANRESTETFETFEIFETYGISGKASPFLPFPIILLLLLLLSIDDSSLISEPLMSGDSISLSSNPSISDGYELNSFYFF
jgi:hypothetical protein